MTQDLLGNGVYTIPEAARLTGTSSQRVRAWFSGWPRGAKPVFTGDYQNDSDAPKIISFLDLIDVLVVAKLRSKGVSFYSIRRAYTSLTKELQSRHPFGRSELLTDGQHVFLKTAQELHDDVLIDLFDRQHAFPQVLEPYLSKITYDTIDSKLAQKWNLSPGVVIDPGRRYGKPIIESCGLPTSILFAAVKANGGDIDRVAVWYGISADDISSAVYFEKAQLGKAA